MNDRHDDDIADGPDRYLSLLAIVGSVVRSGDDRPFKDQTGFLETDAVLGEIERILPLIPFEPHKVM
ncbi:MAG: hypothetical protein BGN87_17755 [Rhizobiales bacterium 65-79]|jgi:hypothetical protein|nr:MAG: hypothetical protein BGN87_17755 [Rhizobiales bacterium 65-79]